MTESDLIKSLLPIARHVVRGPSMRRPMIAGYDVKPGERALLVVNSFYDEAVVEAVMVAIREAGATVDCITLDAGADRELDEIDEFRGFIHNWPGIEENSPLRTWIERCRWAEKVADEENYDILIHTIGIPFPATRYRYEGIQWFTRAIFPAAVFPYALWEKIDSKTWAQVWEKGKGGRVRITDPEGTDVSCTLLDEYYDPARFARTKSRPDFAAKPTFGHLHLRPTPPMSESDDGSGVIAGTTNHMSRPYPRIKVFVENGKVASIEGGGKYGDAWRDLLEGTRGIQYPEFPGKGLGYWWEAALGTHPKMRRPRNAFWVSGGGTVFERRRSGIIHCGIGTPLEGPSEEWAAEKGLPYGHLHVHLLFPTVEITCRDGEKIKLIDRGHLTALDDPEIIAFASDFGDPKEVLREDWFAPIPGVSVDGDYLRDYAPDPATWLKKNGYAPESVL